MNQKLRQDAERIVRAAIRAVSPDEAVRRALSGCTMGKRVYLVAVGKAAWQMAQAALCQMAFPPQGGIVITKYGHVRGELPGVVCFEAGHPVPDKKTYLATQAVLDMTADLCPEDCVLFLLSGGGSALFEKPLVAAEEMEAVTRQLLACGADIAEINTIRKRLSGVKGGRFARWCQPARVEAVILSDVLGDSPAMIASGPVTEDPLPADAAEKIIFRYGLHISPAALFCLKKELPKQLCHVHTQVIGSVKELCLAAAKECRRLGYEPLLLTDHLDCEAREAGRFLADILYTHSGQGEKMAFLAGGETVVHLTGNGKGGRNQELALAAAEGVAGLPDAAVISVGSDGTDGPTDAAGGYVDGDSKNLLTEMGFEISAVLAKNDAYPALRAAGGLIVTGPTGTNVNDIAIGLIG